MILSLMFFLISIAVLPVVLGWILVLAAPLVFATYILSYAFLVLLRDRSLQKISKNLKIGNKVFAFLSQQNSFSWPQTSTSIEISCKTGEVVAWMKSFGVREPESLSKYKTIAQSTAFPDCYDLVTDIMDCSDHNKLEDHYQIAASFMRSGAYLVDREMEPNLRSLNSHIISAQQQGLELVERSDIPLKVDLGTGKRSSWKVSLAAFEEMNPIFMIWQKV